LNWNLLMTAKKTVSKNRTHRRDDVIRRLRRHARRLRAGGIAHLSLFGSVARGEASRGSDIDVLVQLDGRKIRDMLDYAGVVGLVEDIVGAPVDVARRERLRPHVAPSAMRDEIRVF
jgi:predicted nucleotidyltransferase